MKDTKINKYGILIWRLINGFEERSNDEMMFMAEFRTLIVLSIGTVPNDTTRSLKSLIEKSLTSISNLWIKRKEL
jgi:hypothetical protein